MSIGELQREYPRLAPELQRKLASGEMTPREREQSPADKRPARIVAELQAARMLRAVASERQLQEVMVDFWFNHFNVFANKGAVRWYVTAYERDAIRPDALGRFPDLLRATARHPAMLFYLDNWLSVRDVAEVARAFTGWTIESLRQDARFVFRPATHDAGAKLVLGRTIGAGGERDGQQVLDLLAAHLVADEAPPALALARAAAEIGEGLYEAAPPTGHPDRAEAWVNPGALLARLNFALALADGRLPGVRSDLEAFAGAADRARPEIVLDHLLAALLHGRASEPPRAVLSAQLGLPEITRLTADDRGPANTDVAKLAALVLGSPEFQRR